jgi:hypothetical protein
MEIETHNAREDALLRDAAELVRVLARALEGKAFPVAFGAPGDWGYDTPIGAAIAMRPTDVTPDEKVSR